METYQDKEGAYHEAMTKKLEDIAIDIVKRKTGASDVVFFEATVPAETFAYYKLMGPKSSRKVRGVGAGVASNQLNAKRNCQSGIEPSDSSIGDDVEENQRNNTSRSLHVLNQPDVQNTSMGENADTSSCSNPSNIARRLNFDQREQTTGHSSKSTGKNLISRVWSRSSSVNNYCAREMAMRFNKSVGKATEEARQQELQEFHKQVEEEVTAKWEKKEVKSKMSKLWRLFKSQQAGSSTGPPDTIPLEDDNEDEPDTTDLDDSSHD
ncbi:hypothetical protein Cgig2_027676 [Carnegiea gigantea]|uniref:Uncharacterized protein n=1 Tax=Carnegiea gigantea TaxID=171969 RepID=A0A9Q1GIE6_9CARY|nr:hypothetical protein Cgig2_027676 [Carnegiea gigantea]